MNSISCPHCGAEIEIEVRPVQAELPLGPVEIAAPEFFSKKKLDKKTVLSLNSAESPSNPSKNSASERITVNRLTEYPPLSASCEEEELLGQIQQILGEKELRRNGGLWRYYLRICRHAVRNAIEDWKLRTPDQQRLIKNRPAWLTDRYKRARNEIAKEAEKTAQARTG